MKTENNQSGLIKGLPADNSCRCEPSSPRQETVAMWRGNQGFTLIEIIIVVVILGVLGIFSYQFLITSVRTYSTIEKQKSLYDEAAMAMERMSRELRDASSISSPASGGTGSSLSFTKSHGSPQEATTYDITFQLSSGTLQRVGSITANLAERVSAFTVSRVTSPSLEEMTIVLTLSETTGESVTLRTKIYPKNLPYASPRAGRNFEGDWEEGFQ
jgi:prepilin-type N-terminal cleavage/methylation domain-containing protein